MEAEQLVEDLKAREIPVRVVLEAARLMLDELPDDQAQATVLGWMASLGAPASLSNMGAPL